MAGNLNADETERALSCACYTREAAGRLSAALSSPAAIGGRTAVIFIFLLIRSNIREQSIRHRERERERGGDREREAELSVLVVRRICRFRRTFSARGTV